MANCSPLSIPLHRQTIDALAALGIHQRVYAGYLILLSLSHAVVAILLCGLVAWRKGSDWRVLLTAAAGIASLPLLSPVFFAFALRHDPWHFPLSLLRGVSFVVAGYALFLFPNGRFQPQWTRWLAHVFALAIGLWLLFPTLPLNPVYYRAVASLFPETIIAIAIIILVATTVLLNRYRLISDKKQRQQIKWVVWGTIIAVFVLLLPFVPLLAYFGFDPNLLAVWFALHPEVVAIMLYPIAVTGAILSHRLWDIDRLINRTLVYGGLTALVTAVYLLMVGGLGLLAVQRQGQLLGLVLATAVTAILLKPVKTTLQIHVNRLIPPPPKADLPPTKNMRNAPVPHENLLPWAQTAVAHPLPTGKSQLDLIPVQWHTAVRLLLLLFALGAMALLLGAVPARMRQLQIVCTEAVCPAIILVPADFAVLQQWGISITVYAIFHTAAELILIVPVVILWVVVFRTCSHRWMGVLTCLGLVYLGVSLGNILWAWTQESRRVAFLGDMVSEIGATALILLLFLFPDGRFINRWTRISAYLLLFIILPFGMINAILSPGLHDNLPDAINGIFFLLFILLGAAAQIVRYHAHANQLQKQQTKWVVIGVTSLMLGILLWFLFMGFFPLPAGAPRLTWNFFGGVLMIALVAMFPISLGLAILQYRLWDIDLLINRTLVYGGLTLSILAFYTLVVGGLGTMLQTRGSFGVALLATGLIAVLFHPLRERLQRSVNRLMFGERDDPYAVLSKLGRQLQETAVPGQTLPAITATITQTLKLPYAAIELVANDERQPAASSGERGTAVLQEWPLRYQGEIVGWLQAAPRSPGEPFTAKEQQLLGDIAAQAGAAAYSLRLTNALQKSREKLVLAREEERRRIRRDLHDELGPTLASQTFAIDAILDLLENNPTEAARLLHALKAQNQATVTEIRRLVYALRPPALDELGLAGALQAHTAQLHNPHSLQIQIVARPEPLPPLSAAVEVAAYRIALEAMTNAARHAQAHNCVVHLQAEDLRFTLSVVDDGRGLEPNGRTGVGFHSMRERAEELGGRLSIESGEKGGTRVTAVLPLSTPKREGQAS
ncbi:MAG: sensor histidine kinase [Anaerolinea sp.]|nr:sensor histidine kinase [Anaerolinea sp.]